MADNYEDGVSRVLSLMNRQFTNVIWQAGKPPLDSELNLVGQVSAENLSEVLRGQTHSGFLLDPLRTEEDFFFYENAVNYFEMGREASTSSESPKPLIALVNGWVIPVVGFNTSSGKSNAIELPSPPTSGSETHLVFLEVWKAVLNPDTGDNRPSDETIYPYGNTGHTAFSYDDEMIDPTLGFSTTKRVQVQYRIRTQGTGIDIISYPEGLGSAEVLAQGTQGTPVEGYAFSAVSNDAGLYRAGLGNGASQTALGTVDGYVYAVPICAVFRRNSGEYQAVSVGGTPNHNGASARVTEEQSGFLTTLILNAALTSTQTGVVSVTGLVGSGIDDTGLLVGGERFLKIGEGQETEIISISAVNTGAGTITILSRGRAGTEAKRHFSGDVISAYNTRPDGRFADEVVREDLIDLRHAVTLGDWDYQRLLTGAVSSLLTNNLRTSFKQAGVGSNSVGAIVNEVTSLSEDTLTHTLQVDRPDGIRQIWSDAAVMQTDVTFLVDFGVPLDASNFASNLDAGLIDTWTIGGKFDPRGFFPNSTTRIRSGACLFFGVGGLSGSLGARLGFTGSDNKQVRFVAPREKPKFAPFKVRYMGFNRANQVGDTSSTQGLYISPTASSNFEEPFIVLGGSKATYSGRSSSLTTGHLRNLKAVDPVTLAATNLWAVNTGGSTATLFSTEVFDDGTTVGDLVTHFGEDPYGTNSEIYLVVYGDGSNPSNNGAYRIVGNSTSIYQSVLKYRGAVAQGSSVAVDGDPWTGEENPTYWLYLTKVGDYSDGSFSTGSATITFEVRTQYLDTRDESNAIVFTAIDDIPEFPGILENTSAGNLLISTSLQYSAGRGGTARVLDKIEALSIRDASNEYLRNAPSDLDTDAVADIPLPNGETPLPTNHHISTWSGLHKAGEYVGHSERDGLVETEAFIDLGSKSLVLRPYRSHGIKLFTYSLGSSAIGNSTYLGGVINKLETGVYTNTGFVFEVPHEVMPSFGRQDIPYHIKTGSSDPYMEGVNHLFLSQRVTSNGIFKMIGGESDGATGGVYPYLFGTGVGTYGQKVTNPFPDISQSCFVAEKVVISYTTAEFGDTHHGIKLPPHYGIARLMGVYEASEFNDKAPDAGRGAHQSDRETPITNGPTNLLRKDNSLYPIHILENGGQEATGEEGSHTYVVMEHAIDITRADNYVVGNTFTTFNYVVECEVFIFSKGFISHNNFVLPRVYGGDGSLTGTSLTSLENIRMCVPSAIPATDSVYVSGTRTVYQGDPYHTIGGASPSISDAPLRYGLIPSSSAYKLATPRGQLLEDGSSAIEVINRRSLEVLASMDFYTTLGTGALGGTLIENSYNDVGYVRYRNTLATSPERERIPTSGIQPLPQPQTSLFTAPLDANSNYGYATLRLYSSTENVVITYTDAEGVVEYETTTGSPASLSAMATLVVAYFLENGIEVRVVTPVGGTYLNFIFQTRNRGDGTATLGVLADVSYRTRAITRLFAGDSVYETTAFTPTLVTFKGATRVPVNGASSAHKVDISLVGMTSRLPLGILVSDFDFLGEDPLRDESGAFQTLGSKSTSYPSSISVNEVGEQYTKITGSAGDVLQMGDGALMEYGAYPLAGGTRKYRISRGGGSVFGASGDVKGAPLSFLNGSIPSNLSPVLKGGVLACRAMLVKNYPEEAFSGASLATMSQGSEVQLLVVTSAVYQSERHEGGDIAPITLRGEISPSGFGEGFVAADRFKIKGNPLIKEPANEVTSVNPAKYSVV